MKFCDKLQKIRKENNITQEQLADKLNVSRQAVSKWESGLAYPDTEKLIQISKIFNVSLDDLINDSKNNNFNKEEKKFNFMETFNIVFEFTSKIFSMLSAMKFKDKIKFVFEMIMLFLIILFAGMISSSVICEIFRRLFIFMPDSILYRIIYIIETLLYVVWIILGVIIFVKVIKIRYLDYYVIIKDDSVTERIVEEPIKELKDKKEYKVVIRDPQHSSFNIMKKIWKIMEFMFKCLAVMVLVPIVMFFIFMMGILLISLGYLFNGLFFNGITLAVLGTVLFLFLIIYFMYNVIFNRKNSYSKMFIIFIVSISLIGIGIGVVFSAILSFDIDDNNHLERVVKTYDITMKENLVIGDIVKLSDSQIVIDNTLDDIKMDISVYDLENVRMFNSYRYTTDYNEMMEEEYNVYDMINFYVDDNEFELIKRVIDDVKKKKINTYDNMHECDYKIEKVYISHDNFTKIKDNYDKLFD